MTGKRFNRWVVVKYLKQNDNHEAVWLCKCDCGTERSVVGHSLRSGISRSCGCLVVEVSTKKATTHGMKGTRIYNIWKDMKKRCINPNHQMYKHYGGRGIKVCDRWLKFENFYTDTVDTYRDDLSIDRYPNNNGNYEPCNFRWATNIEQGQNKRNNLILTIDGVSKTAAQWATDTGMRRGTIYDRIRTGWNHRDAVFKDKSR